MRKHSPSVPRALVAGRMDGGLARGCPVRCSSTQICRSYCMICTTIPGNAATGACLALAPSTTRERARFHT